MGNELFNIIDLGWPFNLYSAIMGDRELILNVNGLYKVLNGLSEGEQQLIDMRFRKEMSYTDIAKVIGTHYKTASNRIERLIKKLRHPSYRIKMEGIEYMQHAELRHIKERYDKAQKELDSFKTVIERASELGETLDHNDVQLNDIPIEALSMRTRHCLLHAGIDKTEYLEWITEDELYHFRNVGRKSVEEIKEFLTRYGKSLHKPFEPGEIGYSFGRKLRFRMYTAGINTLDDLSKYNAEDLEKMEIIKDGSDATTIVGVILKGPNANLNKSDYIEDLGLKNISLSVLRHINITKISELKNLYPYKRLHRIISENLGCPYAFEDICNRMRMIGMPLHGDPG